MDALEAVLPEDGTVTVRLDGVTDGYRLATTSR